MRTFVAGVMVLGTFLAPCAFAMTPVTPSSSTVESPGLESFRKLKVVPAPAIVVPTVVELPLNTGVEERSDLAIFEVKTNTFIPYFVRSAYTTTPESITAFTNGRSAYELVDGNSGTNVDFAVQSEISTAVITLSSVNPIESTSLVLELDRYVALPTRIAISATIEGAPSQVVVASKVVTGSVVTFPRTSANEWTITLEYAQPLRINELRLVQDAAERTLVRSVRFLAQPQSVYKVYHDADRYSPIHTTEAGNLTDDQGVLMLPVAQSTSNEWYKQADVDADGIPDVTDNCVQMANTDQADVDRNGRGDMCDDFDRDGITQMSDNCPNYPNTGQEDRDGDGVGDVCDTEENRVTEKYPWVPWAGMGIAVLVLGVLFVLVGTSPKNTEEPHIT